MMDQRSTTLSLHGIVQIRLVDPSKRHIEYLIDQLGAKASPSESRPDLTVRFVPEIEAAGLTRLGMIPAGVSEGRFFFLEPDTGAVAAEIPFGRLDSGSEIVCRSDLRAPPFLMELIRLLVLTKGHVAVHAAAFGYGGLGILTMGWPKGGKTGSMLAFARKGAAYVGDEWVILSPGGEHMYGFPRSIGLSESHARELSRVASKLKLKRRLWFGIIHAVEAIYERWKDHPVGRLLPRKTMKQAIPILRRRLRVWVPPGRIFSAVEHDAGLRPDVLFLILDGDVEGVTVSKADPSEVADRMVAVNAFEWRHLYEAYAAFRFAFPDRSDPLIEEIEPTERKLIREAFSDRDCFIVTHRYPGDLEALFNSLRAHL